MFSIPLISLSLYLFLRFKLFFSINSRKNLIILSCLMLLENGINGIVRFFVGLKIFFGQAFTHDP